MELLLVPKDYYSYTLLPNIFDKQQKDDYWLILITMVAQKLSKNSDIALANLKRDETYKRLHSNIYNIIWETKDLNVL